jgi:hypothetical protein
MFELQKSHAGLSRDRKDNCNIESSKKSSLKPQLPQPLLTHVSWPPKITQLVERLLRLRFDNIK